MTERRPRDYDPHALERMPDQPPRDLSPKMQLGRWVLPEAFSFRLYNPRASQPREGKPIRTAYLRSQADYYAYLNQVGCEHWGWQGAGGIFDIKIDPNRYGYYSRAQELYPQVFKSINTEYWRSMSDEERLELMRLQASAQERVGFERSTEKFFIGDIQIQGPLGPGEEPSATELLTAFDTDYALRRKAYQQRLKELEDIRAGRRKRRNQYLATRDESDCAVLGLPSVVEGIKNTPALKSMLPEAAALSMQLAKELAQKNTLDKPHPDSLGLRRLRKKRPTSFRDLPDKPKNPALGNLVPIGLMQPGIAGQTRSEAAKRPINRGRQFQRQALRIETKNKYGLKSRSELSYPQAFAPVATEMWTGLTEDERLRVYKTQAIAQEKTGFEKGAPKYFIEDFNPEKERSRTLEITRGPALDFATQPSPVNWLGRGMLAVTLLITAFCWNMGMLTWTGAGVLVGIALLGAMLTGLRPPAK